MGKESELFKAAQTGNNAVLERAFASYLKKHTGSGGGHGFGSVRGKSHPNIQDDQGYTLLHHATLQSQTETVNLLLRCGASTTISDNSGSCPLHLAAWKGDLEVVKMLVTQGPSRANVNQQNDAEDSALHLASQYGFSEVVEFLLQRHADPLLLNAKAESALDLAAQYGHIDTVHLLISHCPEMLLIQRPQFSPLHLAAKNGHTVVALSLINAGISVNTVCDSGSALHEAAVCGKDETVELLLDKGVNLDLKDRRGRMVLDILEEYTAKKAVKIKTMIQEHKSSDRVSNSPPPPGLRSQNIVAVAQTNCLPVVEESSALAFKRGDTIIVLEKKGDNLFTGACHGKTGSFLAEDVTFYSEHNGELVPTDVTSLTSGSPLRAADLSLTEGVMKVAISTKDPYEHIPGFPAPNSPPQHVPMATNAMPTNTESTDQPDSRSSEASVTTATGSTLQPVAARSRVDKKRLSKKDKIFQLSKDTGSYSELSPINPMQAKKEFGDTLKLNPVGPAFGGMADEGQMTTSHNAPPEANEESPKFQGSYYVLEVGNFNRGSRVHISPPVEVSPPAMAPNDPLHPGYYMLDIRNFEQEEMSETDTKTSGTPEHPEAKMRGLERPEAKTSTLQRAGQYENVSKTPSPPHDVMNGDRGHTPPIQRPQPSHSVPPMYENILVLSKEEQPPPVPKKQRSKTALEAAKVTDDEKRSSLRRREMVYEAVNVGGQRSSSNYSSPLNCTSPVPESNGGPISVPSISEPIPAPESDSAAVDSTQLSSTSLKRISTSSDPFAGLVMSSSSALEDSLPPAEMDVGGELFRERTETVWDNERVEMEWSQIDTLLRDITVPMPEIPPPTETLSSWLVKNGLGACLGALETNGFDSLLYLGGNILVMDDLQDIGITSPDDQYNLMAAVSLLPPPPRLGHVTTVSEWLDLLQLSHLEPKFTSYSLERLSAFWEVELAAVVGVELVGYRKRLQYGISELRNGHPEWTDSPQTSQTLPSRVTPAINHSAEIEVRPPTVAQAISVRKGNRTAKLPSTSWKHPNSALIDGSIYYKTKYLGSVIIKHLHGKQSAEEACLKLKNSTENMLKKPEIILAISWKGVKFVDGHSKVVVSTHAIREISCTSPDLEDKRIFAYITKDKRTGNHYSHVFMADSQDIADEVRMTIAQAFEICYQKVMKARSKGSTTSLNRRMTSNNHTNSKISLNQ